MTRILPLPIQNQDTQLNSPALDLNYALLSWKITCCWSPWIGEANIPELIPNLILKPNFVSSKSESFEGTYSNEAEGSKKFKSSLSLSESLFDCNSVKGLLLNLETVFKNSGDMLLPKRDRLLNNFLKCLKDYLCQEFDTFCPSFSKSNNKEKVANYDIWLSKFAEYLLGNINFTSLKNESIYYGKWRGIQFILGSLISKDVMKQMISSSREKAYFYGLQKCLKNWSQKKLAIILKNTHLVSLLNFMFESDKILKIWIMISQGTESN